MPGEDYQSWSPSATLNGNADTAINWAEGQPRASVNNSSRSEMAAHAKNRNLNNGSIVTGGAADAQTFFSGVNYTTVPTGLRVLLKIGTGLTNTGPTTLNMDGIGAVAIKTQGGADLKAGDLLADGYAEFLYNGTNWISRPSAGPSITGVDTGDGGGGGGGVDVGDGGPAGPGHVGGGTFQTSGTYLPSPSMVFCTIECIGGGAGGGGVVGGFGLALWGGGGGAGGYSRKIATKVEIGGSQVVTVGAAGTAVGGGTGVTGGDSSVGALCIAKGGLGGVVTNSAVFGNGGLGGPMGTGDIVGPGMNGLGGSYFIIPSGGAIIVAPCSGGSGLYGQGGLGGTASDSTAISGHDAVGFGAGGGGGSVNNASAISSGGKGAPGLVFITEFLAG